MFVSQEIVIHGRPDFTNRAFGKTRAKKTPRYVYSTRGMLLHEIAYAELMWYRLGVGGHTMIRRKSPKVVYTTKCGYNFFGPDPEGDDLRKGKRSEVCKLPRPDTVLCGRCQGNAPVFTKGGGAKPGGPTLQEAKARLGCAAEVDG